MIEIEGHDAMTMTTVAADGGPGVDASAGAPVVPVDLDLLRVAPLPAGFSYSSLSTFAACPLRYGLRYVCRVVLPEVPSTPLSFGSAAHLAFEAFTRERRERPVRGEPAPGRDDLDGFFRAAWTVVGAGDEAPVADIMARAASMLDAFWAGEEAFAGETLGEEVEFMLPIDPGAGEPPVPVFGVIDRIDRLPSGGVEVVDYKTGRPWAGADPARSLQLAIYALACRDALGLGRPERVTLAYPEAGVRLSATLTDDQLDALRGDLVARVQPILSREFTATPGRACDWCDFRAVCPERA